MKRFFFHFFIIILIAQCIVFAQSTYKWVKAPVLRKFNVEKMANNKKVYLKIDKNWDLLISTNSQKWTVKKISFKGIPNPTWVDIIWDGKQFVGVIQNYRSIVDVNGLIVTSKDGSNWTIRKVSDDIQLLETIWTGKQYVVIGRGLGRAIGRVLVSPDLVNWKTVNLNEWIHGVAGNKNQIIIVGGDWEKGGKILSSKDGLNWKEIDKNVQKPELWDIIWANNKFVAVGKEGSILTSQEGTKWIYNEPIFCDVDFNNIRWDGKRFILDGSPFTRLMSADGSNWTTEQAGFNSYLSKILWAKDKFIAIADGSNIITSNDGLYWNNQLSLEQYDEIKDIAWNGKVAVIVGSDGTKKEDKASVFISTNGSAWKRLYIDGIISLDSVCWNGKQFLAVGPSGSVATSTDGLTWVSKQSNLRENFEKKLLWDGKQFVLMNYLGNFYTSKDGLEWSQLSQLPQQKDNEHDEYEINDIVWNGKSFIAVGSLSKYVYDKKGIGSLSKRYAKIWSSANGINWACKTLNIPKDIELNNILSYDNKLIAVGNDKWTKDGTDGIIITSQDGVNWDYKIIHDGRDDSLLSIAYNGTRLICAGREIWYTVTK